MTQLGSNSHTVSKCVLGSFLETIVLRVPGELNCLIIDELVWNLVGIKKLLLKCIQELCETYHFIYSIDLRTPRLIIYIFLEM